MVILKSQIFLSFLSLCLPVVLSGHLYIQPSETFRTFFTGGEFFITCVADRQSADRLVWRTPSGEITDTEGRIHVEAQDREEDRVLTLFVNGARLGDDGDYTCDTNREEENSITVKITVLRAISFTGSPEKHVASEGNETTTILCNVIANPEPIVSWIFNRSKIETGGRYKVNKGGLTISNVTRYDAGAYICRAVVVTTETSLIKSHRIKLLVQYPPFFVETESEINSDMDADLLLSRTIFSALHSTASLVCKAEGYPTPEYRWLRNGILVQEQPYDSMVVVYNVTTYDDKSVLNVSLQDVDLLGDYTCRVSNALGTQEKTLTVKEGDPPGRPSVSLKHANNNSAYFALSISKHASGRKKNQRRNPLRVTGYLLQIRTSIGRINGQNPIDWDSADQVEFKEGEDLIVRNLTSDTGYVVRVAAKNAAGYGQFSPEIKFNMYSKNDNDQLVVSDQGAVTTGSGNGNDQIYVNFYLIFLISMLVFVSDKLGPKIGFR